MILKDLSNVQQDQDPQPSYHPNPKISSNDPEEMMSYKNDA